MLDEVKDAPPILMSTVLAIVIAILRVVYERQETSALRMILEAVLCGALALMAGSAIKALGMSEDWTLFAGGAIGFVGSQSIRAYADSFINSKFKR